MALPIFQRTVVNDSGDVISGAEVTVVNEATGLNATIYSDRAGTTTETNPFFTAGDGLAQFYADPGEYRITASGVSGTVTWRYVALVGESALNDVVPIENGGTSGDSKTQAKYNLDIFDYVISQLANGDSSKVAVIAENLVVDGLEYVIYKEDGRSYSVNGVTGTFSSPLNFDPDTGIDSGLSGPLRNKNNRSKREVILDSGSYLSGTYFFPNSHTQNDYESIKIYTAISSTVDSSSEITQEIISDNLSSWSVTGFMDTPSSSFRATISRATNSSFTVSNIGGAVIKQVIGTLKDGV